MEEALLIKPGYETLPVETTISAKPIQLVLTLHEQGDEHVPAPDAAPLHR
jgi:hypothetical protein